LDLLEHNLPSHAGQIAAGIMLAVFVLFFVLERAFPLRRRRRSSLRRIAVNALFSAMAFLAGAFVVTPVATRLTRWAGERGFGLLNFFPLPVWARFALGFLLMDLSFYYWHRANHQFPLLWRFHNVHHVDPDLDVTTSFRFHWAEILYSTAFRALQVSVVGAALPAYLAYEAAFQCVTMFQHSNLRLPIGLERRLNRIVVTPRMHGVHHSIVRVETDSNFSVIFPWWDIAHRSLRLNVPQAEIVIGVPAYGADADNSLWPLLSLPFARQREYWRLPDGTAPTRVSDARTAGRGTMLE